ncbi:MAG: amidohydrolase family protein [Firmicutes bacterium]|nr:amidohydrolase family protein [Bacillota bacterium]
MRYFDCNCSFGESPRPPFRYARDAAELMDEMRFCGIDRALVRHAGMRFGSPAVWNWRLVEGLRDRPPMEPAWAILPSQTGDQPEAEDFIGLMQANGVRALWAFPDEHRYSLDGVTFRELFDALSQLRVPLFVKTNLMAIGGLVREFPGLTIIAANQGPHSLERYLRPLLDAHDKLYVETSYYIVDGLIEEFCQRYGPHRLLFGSGFPDNCSGAALLRLAHAEIDDEAKSAVAGANLERLLREARL